MATKITRPQSAPESTAGGGDDLDVLHPERVVQIGGRKLVVREYGGVEWLRLLPMTRPMVEAIAAQLEACTTPTYDDALQVLSAHTDSLLPLVAQAADIDLSEFGAISPGEIELLLMTWWGVNGRFFIDRAANRVAVARAERRLVQLAGASSTPPSSPTATTSTVSADTPSVS